MNQLDLFGNLEGYSFPQELLEYTPAFLTREEADLLIEKFIETVPWQQTELKMYDKLIPTPRLIAWYGDSGSNYQLGRILEILPWTTELSSLRERIEKASGYTFNSVLLNYYRDGSDSVSWHRDKESALGNRPVIASLSLGQERSFDFRSVTDHKLKYSLPLAHGSLLLMKGDLQTGWEHRIAKSAKVKLPRINLTFRLVRTLEVYP
jgi:alkylated DNA repair dioxygenase AlkB